MKDHKHSLWRVVGVFGVMAIVTMACGLSFGSPNRSPIQLPGVSGNQDTATPAPLTGSVTITPEAATPEAGSGGVSAVGTPQAAQTSAAFNPQLTQPLVQPPTSLAQIYNQANPGTVSILVQVSQNGQQGAGAGSGFILMTKGSGGYIVTNHHVIDGASQIIIKFYNNSTAEGKVVGDDPNADLAIVSVSALARGAHPLPLGDSNKIQVGDGVVAIGNPFALGTSMSYGIISAVGREIPSGFTPYNIPQAIQTDAAINPGNSGGPLIDMRGEVIGVNAQIQTGGNSNGNVGIGFAIPSNIVKLIYPDLISKGSYRWPYLGVQSPSSDALAFSASNAQAQQGALIVQVSSGGPAAKGGLQPNDVVIQADDQKITSFDDLFTYIAYKHPGDKVVLTILRGSQQGKVTVTLEARPTSTSQQPAQ